MPQRVTEEEKQDDEEKLQHLAQWQMNRQRLKQWNRMQLTSSGHAAAGCSVTGKFC